MARGRDKNGELQPMNVIADGAKILINRMTFGDSYAPVTELVAASGRDVAVSRRIVDSIREANIALLQEVSSAASDAPAAETLRKAAEIQRLLVMNSRVDGDFAAVAPQSLTGAEISEDTFDLGQWRKINGHLDF